MAAAAPAQADAALDNKIKAVTCLKAVLEESFRPDAAPNEKGLLDTLAAVRSLGEIPLKVLGATGIGKVVSRMTKNDRLSAAVRESCLNLVTKWKSELDEKKKAAAANTSQAVSTPLAAPAASAAPQNTPHLTSSSGTSSSNSTSSSTTTTTTTPTNPTAQTKTGERWTPPPPKAPPVLASSSSSSPAATAGRAVSSTAPLPAAAALPTPPEKLRAAAAEAAEASSAALEAVEAIPESREDPVVKQAREGKVSIRTEYDCGEAVYTAVLEIRELMRRTMGPARKTRQRASTDEKLLRAIAARMPDSDSILSQWRAGALTDQQCAQGLRGLPARERSVTDTAAEGSGAGKATSRSAKDKRNDDDDGMDFQPEEDDDEDEEEDEGKARPKGRSKAVAKKGARPKARGLMKRPAASLKLAFQKRRRT